MYSQIVERLDDVCTVENKVCRMVATIKQCAPDSFRVRMLGKMLGILDHEWYSPYTCDVFLLLIVALFPDFSAATFKEFPEGGASIILSRVAADATSQPHLAQ